MISTATIRNTAFVVIWFVLVYLFWLCFKPFEPEYIEINSHKYEKFTSPEGVSSLIHVETCGCFKKMDQKQFEFK